MCNFAYYFKMKKCIYYSKNILLLIVALQIINIGLFAQDLSVCNFKGNQLNIINSVTEFVAETVLKIEATFPENNFHNKHHNKNRTAFVFKIQQINLFKDQSQTYKFQEQSSIVKKYNILTENLLSDFVKEITTPPPRI